VRIRRATEHDVDAIAHVLRGSFAEYERLYTREGYAATTPDPARLRERLAEGPTWIALEDDGVIGTVSAVARDDGIYVRSMAVAPAARGRRVARELMEHLLVYAVEQKATRLHLSTTPFLFAAIRLYESLGFRRSGEPPHDLHGTPLVTMTKPLAHTAP